MAVNYCGKKFYNIGPWCAHKCLPHFEITLVLSKFKFILQYGNKGHCIKNNDKDFERKDKKVKNTQILQIAEKC
jgi:hypothetical protein